MAQSRGCCCRHRRWRLPVMLLIISILATASAVAAGSPADGGGTGNSQQPPQQAPRQPPTLASMLSSVTGSLPPSSMGSTLSTRMAGKVAGLSSGDTTRAMAAPGSLDALRPAVAAALGRQRGTEVLSDEDISAINRLLDGDQGQQPLSTQQQQQFAYDTGLPPLAQLVAYGGGGHNKQARRASSFLSLERLGELASTTPMGWVVRSYSVTGDTLLKLRLNQQLQLILRDAIADSAAQHSDLPPSQVVAFAAGNVTFSLAFTGVDMQQQSKQQQQPGSSAGLRAVKAALQTLLGGFDAGHIDCSFQAFPAPRRPHRAMPGAMPTAAWNVNSSSSSMPVPALTASNARKLLSRAGPSSAGGLRRLAAASGASQLTVVYVRLHGVDPTNVTTLSERLASCAAPVPPPPAAAAPPALALAPGQQLQPRCAGVFRHEFERASVPVAGSAFSVAPFDRPQASISLSVAIGVTQQQQLVGGQDAKAAAFLNSTALPDILGAFNLTADSEAERDFVSYLRSRDGGLPPLLGNLSAIIPSLFSQVAAAAAGAQAAQQQQGGSGGLIPGASAAANRGIIAAIVIAVVASVLALVGVVVLLVRRRAPMMPHQGSSVGTAGDASSDRPRRRRRGVYHATKYLPAADPALGREPGTGTSPAGAAGASSGAAAAAASGTSPDGAHAAGPCSRHLERGDSVMSQLKMELADEEDDEEGRAGSSRESSATSSDAPGLASSSSMQPIRMAREQQPQQAPAAEAGRRGPSFLISPASAFAAMSAQLTAQRAAARRASGAHTSNSSGGGSSSSSADSADKVQPLAQSAWHKRAHESGFKLAEPEAALLAAGCHTQQQHAGSAGGGASAGPDGRAQPAPWGADGRSARLVSPFSNTPDAIQLAHSIASDEVSGAGGMSTQPSQQRSSAAAGS